MTADLSARFAAIGSGTTAFVDVGTSNVSFASGFSGSGGFSKLGSGVLTLTGASSYLGVGSVLAGVLNVQNATALGGTAGQTVVASNTTLQLQGGLNFGAEPLTISGNGFAGQSGALLNVSGSNTLSGLVTLGAASIVASDAGTLTLGGGDGRVWADVVGFGQWGDQRVIGERHDADQVRAGCVDAERWDGQYQHDRNHHQWRQPGVGLCKSGVW